MKTKKYNILKKNKTHKKTTRKIKGGKLIAKGTYGCVYKPNLLCETGAYEPLFGQNLGVRNDNIVSKFMNKKDAEKEISEYSKIDIIDSEHIYHLPKPVLCESLKIPDLLTDNNLEDCDLELTYNDGVALNYIYGGIDLLKYIGEFQEKAISSDIKYVERERLFIKLFLSMEKLIFGIKNMNDSGFLHFDIKPQNIICDINETENKYNFNFIDFGLSGYISELQKTPQKLATGYYIWPIEGIYCNRQQFYYLKAKNLQPIKRTIKNAFTIKQTKHGLETMSSKIDGIDLYSDNINLIPNYFQYGENSSSYKNMVNEIWSKIDVYSMGLVLVDLWQGILDINFNVNEYYSTTMEEEPRLYEFMVRIHNFINNMIALYHKERFSANECFNKFNNIKESMPIDF